MMTLDPNRESYDTWPKVLTTEIKDFYTSIHEPQNHSFEFLKKEEKDKEHLHNALRDAAIGRTFCLFDDRCIGWVPWPAKVGDRIAIFLGGTVPILLRPSAGDYIVLGERNDGRSIV